MTALPTATPVAVLGAGAMGAGIAQVAAAAGHQVLLADAAPGAAARAMTRLAETFASLAAKGRMAQADAAAASARLRPVDAPEGFAGAGLLVEAIVEDLAAKRTALAAAEAVMGEHAILATNTSSLSVTGIGAGLARPRSFAGMHFFNPAPLMKLVEVVPGAATDARVTATLLATAEAWGKVAVTASDTPGFIVNRVARPFYGEALRLIEEQAAAPEAIDAALTGAGGFRMGPCALMDLIGHDVNFAVTNSVFQATFLDPRYRPSAVQQRLVAAGWLGRKSGRGLFAHPVAAAPAAPAAEGAANLPQRCGAALLVRTDGRPAWQRAAAEGAPVILHDLVLASGNRGGLAITGSPDVTEADLAHAECALRQAGFAPQRFADLPGLAVLRVTAMLVAEAMEALHVGVASAAAIDLAMQHGTNYPGGPFAWVARHGAGLFHGAMTALHETYRDPRYRGSIALGRAAMGGG